MSDSKTDNLIAQVKQVVNKGLPPVHLWNPEYCGEIDIRIDTSGEWFYQGTPFKRQSIVRLFSTVLRKDDEEYFLVTPVEKVKIRVDDVPFQVVSVEEEVVGDTSRLWFTTSLGDRVCADAEHPLWVEIDPHTQEPSPYLRVRDRLDGRLSRALFYQLVESAEAVAEPGGVRLYISSAGERFALGPVVELDDG